MPRQPSPRTVEKRAYNRAADLPKSYAEHWEREARSEPARSSRRGRPPSNWNAKTKAGHWRIIEKEIQALARQPQADDA